MDIAAALVVAAGMLIPVVAVAAIVAVLPMAP